MHKFSISHSSGSLSAVEVSRSVWHLQTFWMWDFFWHLLQVACRNLHSSREWWPSHELYVLAFGFLFDTCRLFWDLWGVPHDWCNRTAVSWIQLFRSSVASQTTLRFWNEVSFSKRSFLCNSGLLISATNWSRRATSKCSWKLYLNACCCMRTTNSRTVLLAFWTNVWNFVRSISSNWTGLKCSLDFCDWSVP